MRRTDTVQIKTKQGPTDYAKVSARLAEMHADTKQSSVETHVSFHSFNRVWCLCKARVTTPRGKYTGHAMGQMSGEVKALEKLETIAVGRALAFAGYLASGEIASFEEMAEYNSSHNVFINACLAQIAASKKEDLDSIREKVKQMVSDNLIEVTHGTVLTEAIVARKLELSTESN